MTDIRGRGNRHSNIFNVLNKPMIINITLLMTIITIEAGVVSLLTAGLSSMEEGGRGGLEEAL